MINLKPIAWLWKWEKAKGLWMGCYYDEDSAISSKRRLEKYLLPVVSHEEALNEIASLEYRLDEMTADRDRWQAAYERGTQS